VAKPLPLKGDAVRKAMVALIALAFVISVPLGVSFYVRRLIATTFTSPEGRRYTQQGIQALMSQLGPGFNVTMAAPVVQGLKVTFPSIKIQRQGQPWLDLTRTQLQVGLWPQILGGKLGIKLQLRDAATQATAELGATPQLSLLTGRIKPAEAPTEVSFQAKDVRLRTWLEAFGINLAAPGPLALPVDCCSAAMHIKGSAMIASPEASTADLEFQIRYPRVKLPRRLGQLRFKDFALPVKYEAAGWSFGGQVDLTADGEDLNILLTKGAADAPLQMRLSGTAPVVTLAAVATGCTLRRDTGVRLTWRAQGWQC